jgi:hypothetical protein
MNYFCAKFPASGGNNSARNLDKILYESRKGKRPRAGAHAQAPTRKRPRLVSVSSKFSTITLTLRNYEETQYHSFRACH